MGEAPSRADRQQLVARAGVITIATNVALTGLRVLAGVLSGSAALMADAANSGTDILATLVVIGGTRIAALPPDPEHPFGHEKAEPVAAKLIGVLVTITGVLAALGAWHALHTDRTAPVGGIAAIVAAGSILVKEGLARYLTATARRLDSQAMLADAANQRTDVLASGAALVGTLGGRFGMPALDPIMGLVVAGLILRMGLRLYWRAVAELMDPAPEPRRVAHLERAAAGVAGVLSVDTVKARLAGAGIYVDCEICVDSAMTVAQGHEIAALVNKAVRAAEPSVRDVLVHVNPCDPPDPPGHLDKT